MNSSAALNNSLIKKSKVISPCLNIETFDCRKLSEFDSQLVSLIHGYFSDLGFKYEYFIHYFSVYSNIAKQIQETSHIRPGTQVYVGLKDLINDEMIKDVSFCMLKYVFIVRVIY